MENTNNKIIIFVDGDNLDESYTQKIFDEASALGEVFEVHCFCDFVKRKQRWEEAYREYNMQLHYVPGMEKHKNKPDPNTSDIALTVYAVNKLHENPDIDTCVIVANDKDYIPLAKTIKEYFRKKVVMFYTEQDDKAVHSYDKAILLKDKPQTKAAVAEVKIPEQKEAPAKANEAVNAKAVFNQADVKLFKTIYDIIEKQLQITPEAALLAEVGSTLKNNGINYGKKACGKYLKEVFEKFPVLNEDYELILGDKKDRIVRVDK